jgi:hypothetical protein
MGRRALKNISVEGNHCFSTEWLHLERENASHSPFVERCVTRRLGGYEHGECERDAQSTRRIYSPVAQHRSFVVCGVE